MHGLTEKGVCQPFYVLAWAHEFLGFLDLLSHPIKIDRQSHFQPIHHLLWADTGTPVWNGSIETHYCYEDDQLSHPPQFLAWLVCCE